MSENRKLEKLKVLLPSGHDIPDGTLLEYLDIAKSEILGFMYGDNAPINITDVPKQYEAIQLQAVVIGLGLVGGVGEASHSESGISRTFKYPDMTSYIRSRIFPILKVQ